MYIRLVISLTCNYLVVVVVTVVHILVREDKDDDDGDREKKTYKNKQDTAIYVYTSYFNNE